MLSLEAVRSDCTRASIVPTEPFGPRAARRPAPAQLLPGKSRMPVPPATLFPDFPLRTEDSEVLDRKG